MTKFVEYYRIWLIDEVEPEGGFWCYCGVDEEGYAHQLNFDYTDKDDMHVLIKYYFERDYKVEKIDGNQCNCVTEPTGHITEVAFADTPKDAPTRKDIQELLSYVSKYEQLKEVIQNMIDRLDEHGEILLRKDSIIVLALKEAIK